MKQGCGRLADLELSPRCDPVDAAFAIAADEFDPLLVERALARDAGRGWQLDRLAAVSDLIAAEVRSRAESEPLDVTWDWAERIEAVLPVVDDPDVAELRRVPRRPRPSRSSCAVVSPRWLARRERARPRCSEALCADPFVDAGGILLLAPTGKAPGPARVPYWEAGPEPRAVPAQVQPMGLGQRLGLRLRVRLGIREHARSSSMRRPCSPRRCWQRPLTGSTKSIA